MTKIPWYKRHENLYVTVYLIVLSNPKSALGKATIAVSVLDYVQQEKKNKRKLIHDQ